MTSLTGGVAGRWTTGTEIRTGIEDPRQLRVNCMGPDMVNIQALFFKTCHISNFPGTMRVLQAAGIFFTMDVKRIVSQTWCSIVHVTVVSKHK